MSTPDEWSSPGRPVAPPPSGYEAVPTHPPVNSPPGGYLAQTYPAQGYPPAPEDDVQGPPLSGARPSGYGAPGSSPYGPPPSGSTYGPPAGSAYGPPAGSPHGAPVYGPDYGPAYGPGYGPTYGPRPRTDGIAVAALVTGLLSVLACMVILGPVGLGLGLAGLRNTAARGTQGRGMAITGVVTGALSTVVLVAIFIVTIVSAASS